MNASVASYFVLLVSSIVFIGVALSKFNDCLHCPFPRDYKPAMLSIFLCCAWIIVAMNGIYVKWDSPQEAIYVDPPIFVLLISATLFALLYSLSSLYRKRCYETQPKASVIQQAVRRTDHMGP